MLSVWLHKLCAEVTLLWEHTIDGQQARLGAPKAITAAAHKLARLFYRLWTSGGAYTDPGIDAYEQQYRDRTVKYLQKKAHTLGFNLVAQSTATECVS